MVNGRYGTIEKAMEGDECVEMKGPRLSMSK